MSMDLIPTRMRDLKRWATENSLWTYGLALSCCGMEFHSATSPRFDWQRFGSNVRVDPSEADLLIVAGPVNHAMRRELRDLFERMASPKFVISVGSCANTGGMFGEGNYAVVPGVDQIIPVDVYVPGCPPRPESLIHALMRLQERISDGKQARA